MLKGMICAALFVAATAASAATAAHGPQHTDFFEDAWTFFGRAGGVEGGMTVSDYDAATHALAAEFQAVCGDTFCSGDFNNIQPLSLDCSVGHGSGQVGDCVWTFAASAASIEPTTGALSITKQVFECHLGVKGTAAELASFLRAASTTRPGAADGLRSAVVPGTSKSLLNVLSECL